MDRRECELISEIPNPANFGGGTPIPSKIMRSIQSYLAYSDLSLQLEISEKPHLYKQHKTSDRNIT
jgi:hypothetical protein